MLCAQMWLQFKCERSGIENALVLKKSNNPKAFHKPLLAAGKLTFTFASNKYNSASKCRLQMG